MLIIEDILFGNTSGFARLALGRKKTNSGSSLIFAEKPGRS